MKTLEELVAMGLQFNPEKMTDEQLREPLGLLPDSEMDRLINDYISVPTDTAMSLSNTELEFRLVLRKILQSENYRRGLKVLLAEQEHRENLSGMTTFLGESLRRAVNLVSRYEL